MSGTPRTILANLVDGQTDAHEFVPANILVGFPPDRLGEVENAWKPERETAARELSDVGTGGEHENWDWRTKAESVKSGVNQIVAVECRDAVQGLMALQCKPRPARVEPKNEPILYVEYLEAAPWNLKNRLVRPRFLGVGTLLIAAAVKLSLEFGYRGRLGLHSLAQAEPFYRVNCKMTDFGPDSDYYELVRPQG
jgi:hypothetical protein